MDVYSIKQHIINNPHYIEKILDESGYCKINETRNGEIRCAYDEDTNSTSVKVDMNTLSSTDFGRSVSGDIITLVEDRVGLTFRDSLKYICNIVGLNASDIEKSKPKLLPFGGFYKNIGKNYSLNAEIKTFNDDIMNDFQISPSKLFFEDGITLQCQQKYGVGYDSLTGRIVIPHYNTKGELVGIVGRVNSKVVEDDVPKYFPLIPFSKSKTLYRFDKNYRNILDKRSVILCEGEKSVMKLDAMGIGVGLAVGGNYISDIQAQNILSAAPKNIIIGFDEGLDEEHLIVQAKKLKIDNPFIKIEVGYMWDKDNVILKKGSKSAPMDVTKKEFEYLARNCVKYI